MKASELRQKTSEELRQLLSDSAQKLVDTRFQVAIRKNMKNSEISKLRRAIARIQTVLNEKTFS